MTDQEWNKINDEICESINRGSGPSLRQIEAMFDRIKELSARLPAEPSVPVAKLKEQVRQLESDRDFLRDEIRAMDDQ